MGRLFVISLEGSIYSCKHCRTHLALSDDIISKVLFLSYLFAIAVLYPTNWKIPPSFCVRCMAYLLYLEFNLLIHFTSRPGKWRQVPSILKVFGLKTPYFVCFAFGIAVLNFKIITNFLPLHWIASDRKAFIMLLYFVSL